jgi:hypothetical protein
MSALSRIENDLAKKNQEELVDIKKYDSWTVVWKNCRYGCKDPDLNG